MQSEPMGRATPLRTAFVMEQALGHVTHYRNLRQFTDEQPDIDPVWLPISFDVSGPERFVPILRRNWSVRASWRARRALDVASARRPIQAAFFHSQVTSLFSTGFMRRVPSVISLDATPVNYDSVGEHYGHKAARRGYLDRKKYELNLQAFQAAAGLVAWSDWARRSLVDDYGVDSRRIRVMAPGAPPSFFAIGDARSPVPVESTSQRARLLFVGGDFDRKGGPLLLELMRGPLGSQCELHLVTQRAVAPQPHVYVYRGLQPNSPELCKLFAEADLFVLPTHADCLAVVLEEAAASALPVITTSVGALSEAVLEGESGFVIPPNDAGALRAAVQCVLDNPSRRIRMGRAARALAYRKFDANRNDRALLDYIQEIAEPGFERADTTPVLNTRKAS